MKTNILLLSLLTLGMVSGVQAQAIKQKKENLNQIKVNLLTLATGKYSVEYERQLSKHLTIGTAVSYRDANTYSFASEVADLVDNQDFSTIITGFKGSNFSVTPELRIYTSSKGNMRGFYLAPFVKYAKHDVQMPYNFDVQASYNDMIVYDREEIIDLKGNVSSYTAGLSLGVNFKLSKQLMLDWRIMGPGYGVMKGKVAGSATLNEFEQTGLDTELSDLVADIDDLNLGVDVEYNVHGEGATFQVNKSPWATVRSGLSIAYRF